MGEYNIIVEKQMNNNNNQKKIMGIPWTTVCH